SASSLLVSFSHAIGFSLRRLPRLGVNALTTYELRIPQAFSRNTTKRLNKPPRIGVLSFVVPKFLFVQIPEQMKRLNVHIRSSQCSLEQRPEVFKAISVDMPLSIGNRVINHVVSVFIRKLVVRAKAVGDHFRTL